VVDDKVGDLLIADLEQFDVVGSSSKLLDFVNGVLKSANFTQVEQLPHENKNPHHEEHFDLTAIHDALEQHHAVDFKVYHKFFPE